MKLVVGLGNPGRKYQGTRHNVGFEVLAQVARNLNATNVRTRFDGEIAEATCDGNRLLLLSPLTFMNLSGKSVQAARDFYQLSNADILIICDDFQLPLGRLRFRPDGSSGGQKGLEDVIRRCGNDVPRLRLGIGPVPARWDPADFVLGRFAADDSKEAEMMINEAAAATIDWIRHGTAYSMNKYNGSAATDRPKRATDAKNRDAKVKDKKVKDKKDSDKKDSDSKDSDSKDSDSKDSDSKDSDIKDSDSKDKDPTDADKD